VKSACLDAKNKTKMAKWADDQISKATPEQLRKGGGKAAFAAQLRTKVGKHLAKAQRTAAVCAIGKSGVGKAGLWSYCPPGLDVVHAPGYGRIAIAAGRGFDLGDIVLVEKLALKAKANADTDAESSPSSLRKQLVAQLDAFSAADMLTRQRVLLLHQHEQPLDEDLAAAIEEVAQDKGTQLSNADGELSGEDIARIVPRIFFEHGVNFKNTHSALGIVGSTVAHSCLANCTRVFDCTSGPTPVFEFMAIQPIKADEPLTLDHMGQKLWSRKKRVAFLEQLLKGRRVCACTRCARPDREASLPCPACSPVEDRPGGFMTHPEQDPREDIGYITAGGAGVAAGCKWQCDKDPSHRFSDPELEDLRLPAEAPAKTYLGLLEYADKLGSELELAPDDVVASNVGAQYEQAIRMAVGPRHWAAYVRLLRLLQVPSGGRAEMEEARGEQVVEQFEFLWWFVCHHVGLHPVPFIGPAATLAAGKLLAQHDLPDAARVCLTELLGAVPARSEMYTVAAAALAALPA
jgi:hypothetical protein